MTAPFVTTLRSRGEPLRIAPEGASTMTVRVEMPEVWDTIRVLVTGETTVAALKTRALAALFPSAESGTGFVMKLKGWEVLDEGVSLTQAGAVDGSIFLLTHRFRRPVR